MIRDEFERRFDQAFERAFVETDLPGYPVVQPDPLPSWQNLQQTLKQFRRRRAFRSNAGRGGIAAAAILLAAALFGGTESVKAIQPLYESIRSYPGHAYGFFFGRPDDTDAGRAKTAPPSQARRKVVVTQEEAGHRLSFAAPLFGYLPDRFSADHVHVYFYGNNEKADFATYRFHDKTGGYLYISFRRLRSQTAGGVNLMSEGTSVRKIDIDGKAAFVKDSEDGSLVVQTFRNRILVEIIGNIQEKDAIRLIQNLQ